MRKFCLVTFIFVSLCSIANAQTASTFAGSWKVTWQTENRLQEAILVITESGAGSWKTSASSRTNPCIGRQAPVALEYIKEDEATVHLKFSEALAGCADASIRVTKINDKALTGTRGNFELTITRQ